MDEGRERQAARRERRGRRRRQVRRRRATALAVLAAIVAAAVAGPLALSGRENDETSPSGPTGAVAKPAKPTPKQEPKARRSRAQRARPDGTLGDRAVSRACELLSRAEIRAQFGGPVGRPAAMWPACRWDVGRESFVSLRYAPSRPIEEARRRAYVEQSVSGLGTDAFFGNDRSLYFGDSGSSFRLLYQRASEFTGIREAELIALAREILAREASGARAPGSSAVPAAAAGVGESLRAYLAGDSLAAGPGWAFLEVAATRPSLDARAEYEVGTGLLRADYFDWVRHLRGITGGADPQVVVFMVGANDSQDAIVRGRYHPVGTAVWDRVYRARVSAAMSAAGAGGRKVVWVGMPPMRDPALFRGMAEVNKVFRSEAAKRPYVTFVDTWSLFDGSSGGYADQVSVGSGELVSVRLPDGIHLNVEGSRLLAREIAKAVERAGKAPA